ncbi:MAG: type II toxin-antitoxin system antitoxin SocA domain-containing protein [Pseudomonadota bacterium]
MSYDSRIVANKIWRLGQDIHGVKFTPMQIIKLAYIAHGWMLGLYRRPLIMDDIEAWQYGPVIRRIYNAVKKYGRDAVEDSISGYTDNIGDLTEDGDTIKQVVKLYGHLNGVELSSLTHQKDTPWDLTWKRYGKNVVIPQDVIQAHFEELAESKG